MKHQIQIDKDQFELTDKEYRFANYYLGEARFNAAEAARLAGYSEHTARQQGSRLLSNVYIEKYIKSRTSKILNDLQITQERILKEYVTLAFGNLTDYLQDNWKLKPLNEIPIGQGGPIDLKVSENFKTGEKAITISTNLNVKVKALEFLWELVKDK
ncbi:MAG: terminase small subunit [Cytophagia bacterium]|nr:terminase small subunit [Cytophagia bacterium]